jgi:hypothetical protein
MLYGDLSAPSAWRFLVWSIKKWDWERIYSAACWPQPKADSRPACGIGMTVIPRVLSPSLEDAQHRPIVARAQMSAKASVPGR